jgi:nucleotide-binding universal stress UspA family protein
MLSLRRLLVATDFSDNAEHARLRARNFARAVGAELHTLHVRTGRDDALDLDALAFDAAPGERLYPPAIRTARTPAEGILAYAEEHAVDLIAIGTQGRSGLSRWVLGSEAEAVVRRAACPVLSIREGLALNREAPAPPRRIVAAVDFSEGTRSLVAHARAIADLAGARLDVVYVLEEPAAFRLFEIDGFRTVLPRLASRAEVRLRDAVETVPGTTPVRTFVLTGDPARALVRYAEAQRADLVFIGTHGDAGPRARALGSVTERVMRSAPCPVFTLNVTAASLVRAPVVGTPGVPAASARPPVPPAVS